MILRRTQSYGLDGWVDRDIDPTLPAQRAVTRVASWISPAAEFFWHGAVHKFPDSRTSRGR